MGISIASFLLLLAGSFLLYQMMTLPPSLDQEKIPNISGLMTSSVILRSPVPLAPGPDDACYVTSSHSEDRKRANRHNVRCRDQKGSIFHTVEMNLSKIYGGTAKQMLYRCKNSTIGLHLHGGAYCNRKVMDIVKLISSEFWPELRIIILSGKDASCRAEIKEEMDLNLKAPNLQGTWQVQSDEIILNLKNPEHLTKQSVALMQQTDKRLRFVAESAMTPEVAAGVNSSLTANHVRLSSADYELEVAGRNYTEELQLPLLPAEGVDMRLLLSGVEEMAEVQLKLGLQFPVGLRRFELKIGHGNAKILNPDHVRELCAEGEFFSGKSRSDDTKYVVSCKFP